MKELDFSLLEEITRCAPSEKAMIHRSLNNRNVSQEEKQRAQVYIDRQKETLARAAEVWKIWSESLNKSESLRTDLLKGLRTGESEKELFLLAIDCIYILTGDKAFYKTALNLIEQ